MPVHNAVSIACRLAIGIIRLLARCRGTTIVATVLVGCLQAAAQDSTVPVQSQEWAVTAQVTSIKASAEFAKLAASERLIDKPLTPEAPDARPLGIKFPISRLESNFLSVSLLKISRFPFDRYSFSKNLKYLRTATGL